MTEPLVFTIVALLVGLCVGSFLNVVIYRLPIMLEAQWKAECASARGHFESFGTHLPPALADELTALETRLG